MKNIIGHCEHFQNLKIIDSITKQKELACKFCFQGFSSIWICLSKGCASILCGKNNYQHLKLHLQQSKKIKKFHSLFINKTTAQIRCIHCNIEIADLDISQFDNEYSNKKAINKQNAFAIRAKILPGLNELVDHKIFGQLQNSLGHQKISRGLVGIFANKYNHIINSALQFLAHCKFVKDLILEIKLSERQKYTFQNNRILKAVQDIIRDIEKAKYRAIHSTTISELYYKEKPELLGYKLKDPFEIILHLFGLINEETISYYQRKQGERLQDQWDLFYKKNTLIPEYIIYNTIQSTISVNYYCSKCSKASSVPQNIQFLKLGIPKKKRKTKEIQKQLASYRCTSPLKTQRKSLINLFKEEEYPLTIPELIIELMKSPLHKEIQCETCSSVLKKMKLHFQKLPDILMIQIARFNKDKDHIDDTPVLLSTESIDLGPFTTYPQQQAIYDFQTAICLQKNCLFPLIVISEFNKQKYIIRNQIVQVCKQKLNPYIMCYKKRISETAKQKLIMIKDQLKSEREKKFQLPDFWFLQLENGIEKFFHNQMICKHNCLKPGVQSKMTNPLYVSEDIYEDLANFYRKQNQVKNNKKLIKSSSFLQAKKQVYRNQICYLCEQEVLMLEERRKKERQYVILYDKLKLENLPHCMISYSWIKKWSNYLYNHEKYAYLSKGFPLPSSIDNKILLQGNKCRPNIVKNQHFKVLNIYLWKFLKEIYGGGPQIRYKWKEGRESLDQQLIIDIKNKASEIKSLYQSNFQSPKKSIIFNQKSSFLETYHESFINPQIIEDQGDIEKNP